MSDIPEDQSIASMESAITLFNAETSTFEHSLEKYDYSPLSESNDIAVYHGLVSIENRIHAYGVSVKDVAALENLVPGILLNNMPASGFTYAPSMQNVEVALERINLSKIALLVQSGALVVSLVKKIINWIEKRYKEYRNKRALEAAKNLKAAMSRKRTQAYDTPAGRATMAANVRAERETQSKVNGISTDTSRVATGGSGASHDSKIKGYTNPNLDKDKRMFKEIFVGRFGVPENTMAGFLSCTNVRELFGFLNRVDAKGPTILKNDAHANVKRLLTFINQSTMELDRGGVDAQAILQQIDGYLMGNQTGAIKIEAMVAPLAALLNSGSDNLGELIKEGKSQIQMWARPGSLQGCVFLSQPDGMASQLIAMVEGFESERVISSLSKYKDIYTKIVKDAKAKLERYAGSGDDQQRVDNLSKLVNSYLNQMQGIVEVLSAAITLHGQVVDYMAALSTATATYVS